MQTSCEVILQRVDDYIDRELAPGDVRMVERHIAGCVHCAGRQRFQASMVREIRRRLRRIRVPGTLLARIQLRLDAERTG
jgi:anti-sigma factor (TIGR02949 family)